MVIECLELSPAKARDLQSTSTLEQFMAKLCLHHQRQIVDALGFLQTEVNAISSSSMSPASASKPTCSVERKALPVSSRTLSLETPAKGWTGQKPSFASTPKGTVERREDITTRCSRLSAPEQISGIAVSLNVSEVAGPVLGHGKDSKALATPLRSTGDSEGKRLGDHAPLKIKIMKTNNQDNKLSCVLTTAIPACVGTVDERQGNINVSTRADSHGAGIASSVKRQDHASHKTTARQRVSFGQTKDKPVKQSPLQKTPNTLAPVFPRTARKTIKGSYHLPSSMCNFVTDPDLGHCDIVYINKPITECFQERQHSLLPRRNARKSTRGHMYVEEMWELKTVRTLARKCVRDDRDYCSAPMPESITVVAPKQLLGKPEGVPLVDMPFAGAFEEALSQKTPLKIPTEMVAPVEVEASAASGSAVELIVETSQTDQSQREEQTAPPPQSPPTEEDRVGTISALPRQSLAPEDNSPQSLVATADQCLNNEILLNGDPKQAETESDLNPEQNKVLEEPDLVKSKLNRIPESQNIILETQQEVSETPFLESPTSMETVAAEVGAGSVVHAEPQDSQSLVDLKGSEDRSRKEKAETEKPTESKESNRLSISSSSVRPGRMPLRSESSKADMPNQSVTHATPMTAVESRKSVLRTQTSPVLSASALVKVEKGSELVSPNKLKSPMRHSSPIKMKPAKRIKSPQRDSPLLACSPLPSCSVMPLLLPKLEPAVQSRHKFLELLDMEENQQKMTMLNNRFDKMHRGWVQMDKDGHPAPRHKKKGDRQAAIWKSKRRVRKPKSSEHQRFSLVQMLFKNDLDLASICRWYMESTETQSLVIVKKVNTRLPSETQLLFPGMSQRPSQGIFPSLQAERLKKHLKKFAIASPVKSNPKNQKLIAKALAQEVSTSSPRGKEKRELTTATRISTKAYLNSAEAQVPPNDGQKASAKAKNPTSARILRKYSNLREKMQGQQSSKNPKAATSTELKASKSKPSKPPSKKVTKPSNTKLTKPPKLKPVAARTKKISASGKSVKELRVVKTGRAQPSPSRKNLSKAGVQKRSLKTSKNSRSLRVLSKKGIALTQSSPQRVVDSKVQKNTYATANSPKTDANKKQVPVEKCSGVDKTIPTKVDEMKVQTKRLSQSRAFQTKVPESKDAEGNGPESAVETQPNMGVKTPGTPDQVLTRSQRKIDATPPRSVSLSSSPKPATKKANEATSLPSGTHKGVVKRALDPTQTVSTSPMPAIKRANEPVQIVTPKGATKRAVETVQTGSASPKPSTKRASEPGQSGTPKAATKRTEGSPQTPAKRTRISLNK
ncbi:hypothetical protein DPEC_G00033090 [Dallia pectoralis]|uniref:Uncharacterized protein n=1 Tax=Dallia pectoralis TaxID=75939 RepID=A0ACC2HDD7_DALPE|nr:hypothetical protein DPEC_G00033090 [Dallia pectoralis]